MSTSWCIWYANGLTFSDVDGSPDASPCWGAVVIGQRCGDEAKKILYDGSPWFVYHYDLGLWLTHDAVGLHDVVMNQAASGIVARPGRWTKSKVFWNYVNQAKEFVGVNRHADA